MKTSNGYHGIKDNCSKSGETSDIFPLCHISLLFSFKSFWCVYIVTANS